MNDRREVGICASVVSHAAGIVGDSAVGGGSGVDVNDGDGLIVGRGGRAVFRCATAVRVREIAVIFGVGSRRAGEG